MDIYRGAPSKNTLFMSQIRRSLSLEFVRAQALCLAGRLGQLGDGARAAANRRAQAGREEEGRQRAAGPLSGPRQGKFRFFLAFGQGVEG